jgi:TonB-linked SusC/RagA family outer membrane protein
MYLTAVCRSGLIQRRIAKQTIKIMKLTTVLLIVACLQVSAKGFTQKVTIKENNISLQKVFEEIRKQTGIQFFYADETIRSAKTVSLAVKKETVEKVLDICFRDQSLTYTIAENTIIVKRKVPEPGVITAPIPEVVVKEVRGKVTDEKGQPLSGVSVSVKGTTNGTTTDANGNFSITVPDDAVLVFSYVGFSNVEEKVAGRTTIELSMKPVERAMDEIVVIGYGTQRKRDLTGSVSSVKGEEVAKMPSTNPIASLQGRVPGLTISNSGRAGASPVVRIRGVNSTNSASPVYVVDGILQDNIDYLNPADIESIDILRDPSSIAIYGMRAANGVIAVTLKKAARGKTVVNLQSTVAIQRVQDRIEVTDAEGFKKLYNAQLANLNAAPFDYTNYTANTNWQDLVLRNAVMTTHNLSIANSGEKTTTHLNLGYTNQEGVLKNDQYERFLLRLGEEIKINQNIKVGGDLTGYHFISNPPAASVTNALWAAPIVPIQFDENTYYSMPSFQRAQVGNPMAALKRNDRNSINKGYRVIGNLFAEIKFLKNFTWKSVLYGDFGFNTGRSYSRLPFSFINLGEGVTPTTTTYDNSVRTSVSQEQSENKRFQQDHYLTFDKRLGKGHSITAVAGFTTQYEYGSSVSGTRRDTAINVPDNPDFWYLGIVNLNNPILNAGAGYERSLFGSFVRAAYSYKGKYLVNGTFRRDASSKFAPENRWASSGSLGLGWVISDEDFFDKVKGIDFLKVKASYGTVTNSNGIPDNLYQPGIQNASTAVFGDNVYTSIQAAYEPDPNIRFEVVRGSDLGFETRLLQNRLSIDFTRYDRKTSRILTLVPRLATANNSDVSLYTNLGEISNKGIEINSTWTDGIGKDFKYSVSANFSYNKNKVEAIGDKFDFQITGNGGVNLTTTGQSIGYFYGYTQVGVYQSTADLAKMPGFANSLPGDIAYADINGDGAITPADRGYIGSPFPDYNYGASISLEYKNFDMDIQGQGSAGHKIYTQRRTSTFAVLNYETMRLNAWTAPGTSNIEPVMDNTRGNNFLMSTYYLEPGDFFRIRLLQFGYTFRQSFITKAGIQKARFFISAQNLKTWSKVTGYSPEPLIGSIIGGGADNGAYPVPAIYSLGLNLTF